MCAKADKNRMQRCPDCEQQMENSFQHLFCAIDTAVDKMVCRVVRELPKNNFAHK